MNESTYWDSKFANFPRRVDKRFAYLKEKHFSSFFAPCFDLNEQAW